VLIDLLVTALAARKKTQGRPKYLAPPRGPVAQRQVWGRHHRALLRVFPHCAWCAV